MAYIGKGAAKTKTVPAKDKEEWRQPIHIDMTFGEGLKTRPRRHRPSSPSALGWMTFLLYVATFIFYAYCRIGHTLSRSNSAFAYQVCFLLGCTQWLAVPPVRPSPGCPGPSPKCYVLPPSRRTRVMHSRNSWAGICICWTFPCISGRHSRCPLPSCTLTAD